MFSFKSSGMLVAVQIRSILMAGLTTHILDTARGCPAAGLSITLYRLDGQRHEIIRTTTNMDGRCDAPLIEAGSLQPGKYELVFHAGEYFHRHHIDLPEPLFLDDIPIQFGIAATDQHYHVPLLLSPFGYSTYRGS